MEHFLYICNRKPTKHVGGNHYDNNRRKKTPQQGINGTSHQTQWSFKENDYRRRNEKVFCCQHRLAHT